MLDVLVQLTKKTALAKSEAWASLIHLGIIIPIQTDWYKLGANFRHVLTQVYYIEAFNKNY
jgi:hypothetical protein